MDKSWTMPTIFLGLNFTTYLVLVLFIFPVYEFKRLIYVNIFLEAVMLVFWGISSFTNPGYISKPPQVNFLKLLQLIDPVQICPDCQIVRTPRSRHCGACNHCVERFDHHCPWINNCVGTRNHWAFMIFLITMGLSIAFNFVLTIHNIVYILEEYGSISLNYNILSEEIHLNHNIIKASQLLVIIITGLFLLPLIILLIVQFRNFCTNRTTNERYGGKKYKRHE
jgi:hypothetical protein